MKIDWIGLLFFVGVLVALLAAVGFLSEKIGVWVLIGLVAVKAADLIQQWLERKD